VGCSVPGCQGKHEAKGFCGAHYRRALRHGGDPLGTRPKSDRICSVPDCGRPHESHGYCQSHADRFRRHGDPLVGARAHVGTATMARPCAVCKWYDGLDTVDRAFVDKKIREYGNLARLHKTAQMTGLDVGYSQFKYHARWHQPQDLLLGV